MKHISALAIMILFSLCSHAQSLSKKDLAGAVTFIRSRYGVEFPFVAINRMAANKAGISYSTESKKEWNRRNPQPGRSR